MPILIILWILLQLRVTDLKISYIAHNLLTNLSLISMIFGRYSNLYFFTILLIRILHGIVTLSAILMILIIILTTYRWWRWLSLNHRRNRGRIRGQYAIHCSLRRIYWRNWIYLLNRSLGWFLSLSNYVRKRCFIILIHWRSWSCRHNFRCINTSKITNAWFAFCHIRRLVSSLILLFF